MKLLHDSLLARLGLCAGEAFTLMELLVVASMVTMLFGSTFFIGIDSYKRYVFRTEQQIVVSVLEKARSRAMNNIHQSAHGVCFHGLNYVIFRSACVANDPMNEYIPANKLIAQSSNFDTLFPIVLFSQSTVTTTPVKIEITDGIRIADIVINYEGTILW